MLLSARILKDVQGVNSFEPASVWEFVEGDSPTLYLQLVDASLDRAGGGRRFVPATGATLSIQIQSLDAAKVITRAATNPFGGDTSIWALAIMSTDALRGTANVRLTLTEGVKVTRGFVGHALRVTPQDNLGSPVTAITGF
jgi:hypothetical protein